MIETATHERAALVTGATSGIGQAVAFALAGECPGASACCRDSTRPTRT